MLGECPTCEGRNTPGAPRCRHCGYRLTPREQPFVVPENSLGLRIEFAEAPVGYRTTPEPRLRITRRSEVLPQQVGGIIIIGAGLGAIGFYAMQYGQPQGAVGAAIALAALGYWLAARIENRLAIEVDSRGLRVRQTPIPMPGATDLNASDIVEVYCDARRHRGEVIRDFRVHVRRRNGERRMIVSGLSSGDEAQLVEDLIEEQLGIPDALEMSRRLVSPQPR